MKNFVLYSLIAVMTLFLVACSKGKTSKLNKLIEQGKAKINSGDFTGGLADLNEALKINDKNAEVYYWIGRSHMAVENPPYSKTIENYNKAIALNSDYAVAYCSLATVYDQLREQGKACEMATKSMAAFEKQGLKPEDQMIYKQAEMLKEQNCK